MNARNVFLTLYRFGYEQIARPLIFTRSPEDAHRDAMRLLAALDGSQAACEMLRVFNPDFQHEGTKERSFTEKGRIHPAPTSSVLKSAHELPSLMLAAGFVKGRGFADEESALRAVVAGENIIPGWRAMPALVGAVEFGSFTRYPRLGNSGAILWRDPATRSTQNRIGLRNPGAKAAAQFLGERRHEMPWYRYYGINIGVSPGVSDDAQEIAELYESMSLFLDAGLRPHWFTLNLSCPNTEDDPEGNQTAAHARVLCSALLAHTQLGEIPLWIKIGPNLGAQQYAALMAVCAEVGVGAVIATNTLAQAVPQALSPTAEGILTAGVGGGRLHSHALDAVRQLAAARAQIGCDVKIVGCGGVLDGVSARAMLAAGADTLQYWSALIYRGPLAAAVIRREIERG